MAYFGPQALKSTWKALPSPRVAARFCALASRCRHADVLVDRRGVLGLIRGVGAGAPRAQSRLTWHADKAHTNGGFQLQFTHAQVLRISHRHAGGHRFMDLPAMAAEARACAHATEAKHLERARRHGSQM
jgi:hypothetical protein